MSCCLSMGELVTCQGRSQASEDSWHSWHTHAVTEGIEQTFLLLDVVALSCLRTTLNWLLAHAHWSLEW